MLEPAQISKIRQTLKDTRHLFWSMCLVCLGTKKSFLSHYKTLIEQGGCALVIQRMFLDISVSRVSQHLRILEMSRMVEGEKMGQMMCYRPKIEDPSIKKIISLM